MLKKLLLLIFLGLSLTTSISYAQTPSQAEIAQWRTYAQKGNSDAQYNLGVLYDQGWGVKQNDATAAKWYEKAAKQGDTKAQFNLGNMYYEGRGVKQNKTTAAKWFEKAAKQGHVRSQSRLGFMYEWGEGVKRDLKKPNRYINKPAMVVLKVHAGLTD
ncbi:tetratricopeptide repeat protein [Testudinibacter aquarius]|uniref:Sel1 repeat family protein n=1 Tax=Testudinibacter aquarius TaxID=1524974 RepID=A0A4R3Y6V6_9PAST|nr:tetratricopeptide repeat protein [Testudinibacter aquarius]KAE9526012.1 hypothetical protein A1D24_02985 [Testudinibacter aquarius]TCV87201.1 Sel1 repeat-containing protein [Testudinibacter aquarius]TNG91247.1 sel1 repeat family protein [Testudinibacter aquarius]